MGQVTVKLYGAAVEAAKQQTEMEVDASNVRELLSRLCENFGDSFKRKILDSNGAPQSFVNVYVNNTDIRHLNDVETELKDGDEVLILPAVAGG